MDYFFCQDLHYIICPDDYGELSTSCSTTDPASQYILLQIDNAHYGCSDSSECRQGGFTCSDFYERDARSGMAVKDQYRVCLRPKPRSTTCFSPTAGPAPWGAPWYSRLLTQQSTLMAFLNQKPMFLEGYILNSHYHLISLRVVKTLYRVQKPTRPSITSVVIASAACQVCQDRQHVITMSATFDSSSILCAQMYDKPPLRGEVQEGFKHQKIGSVVSFIILVAPRGTTYWETKGCSKVVWTYF